MLPDDPQPNPIRGCCELLPEWTHRNMSQHHRPSEPPNRQLFDERAGWHGPVLDALARLGLRCTDTEAERRPMLAEVEALLEDMVRDREVAACILLMT